MPFQPQNYANIAPQGNSWVRDFIDNLTSGYKAGRLPYETGQLEQKQNLDNNKQALLNIFQGEKNKEQVPKFNSDMRTASLAQAMQAMLNQEQPTKFSNDLMNSASTRAFQNANTNKINTMTPLDAIKQHLENNIYTKYIQSQIDANEANANLRNNGGSNNGGGVFVQAQKGFNNAVRDMLPNATNEQLKEAIEVYKSGGNSLKDGTQLPPMSRTAIENLSNIGLHTTTAKLINQNATGAQAEAELPVTSKYINDGIKPYSKTVLGVSFDLLKDSFSKDKSAQERLGRYDAANVLTTDQAAIQNKLNSGESTATITSEIIKNYPKSHPAVQGFRTQDYRNEFTRYLNEALQKGFQARRSVPIDAYNATRSVNSSPKSGRIFNLEKGGWE